MKQMKRMKGLVLGYVAIFIVFMTVISCGGGDSNDNRTQCVACTESSQCAEGLSCIPFTNINTGAFLGNACGLSGLVCPTVQPAN